MLPYAFKLRVVKILSFMCYFSGSLDRVPILRVSKRWFWDRSLWKLLRLADLKTMHALCAIGWLSSQNLSNSMTLSLSWYTNNSRQSAHCPHFMKPEGKLPCSEQPAWWIQSTCTQIISLILILILSSHSHLRLPSSLFPSSFHNKTFQTQLFSPIRATLSVQLIRLDLITG